jgi:hypothetical protein
MTPANFGSLNFFRREAFVTQSIMISFLYFETTTLALSYSSDSLLRIREKKRTIQTCFWIALALSLLLEIPWIGFLSQPGSFLLVV